MLVCRQTVVVFTLDMERPMRLFGWIRPLPPPLPPEVPDPWAGSGDTYVYRFRQRLDEIAEELSRPGRLVKTRFNTELKCAELYVPGGEVLFQVQVHGEAGAPYVAPLLKHPSDQMDLFHFLRRFPIRARLLQAV